jgi:phage terminase large subunit
VGRGNHAAAPRAEACELTDEGKLALLERCQKDGVFHVEEVQGVDTLEPFQRMLIRTVWEHSFTVVRSCHDMGKTWTMAKLVLAFTSSFPFCKVVTTAPTARQVKLLLWSEIRAGHAASRYPLGGEMLVQEWQISPDWFAVGFTTQKQASSGQGQTNSGFQGIHAPGGVLVIFDEATGIPPDVWKQLEGLMTQAHVRFVAIGNPTTKACEFYKCFSDPTFKKLHLSCYDSPNLIANKITSRAALVKELDRLKELPEDERLRALESYKVVRPHLLTANAVMRWALKWGIDHPLFVSKAEGDFPEEDERCLMPLGAVERAQQREGPEKRSKKVFIGVDPARFGRDETIITMLRDVVVETVKALQKRRTTAVSGEVIAMVNALSQAEKDETIITIDGTGIGSGVVDELHEYQQATLEWRSVQIRETHFGETFKVGRDGSEKAVAEKTKRFANKKAEMFFYLAEDLKARLVLPEQSAFYSEELPTIIYNFDSKGRWVMEDKEAYKKRTGLGSPDRSDSLALANYGRYDSGGVAPFTAEMAKPNRKREKEEW